MMKNKKFQVYFDCGFSKVRAGAFKEDNMKENFLYESKFFFDHLKIDSHIQNIISYLENDTKEYINEVNLMIDSSKMLSIGISIQKKLDRYKLLQDDIQFLIQDAKQQILKFYKDKTVVHIIVKNYKIDNKEYIIFPNDKKCNLISLDIIFLCLPKKIIEYYKKIFFELNISINKILCSSYTKSINYKDNFPSVENIAFIDIGFNKTTVIFYINGKISFLDVLPIGGHHISLDISKILKVSLEEAERIKLYFTKDQNSLKGKKFSLELLQKIIFARTEEILELCAKSIKLNLDFLELNQFKMILMGEGSKILDNNDKDKICFASDIDLLDESTEDICQSGLRLIINPNIQEIVTVPKKQVNEGFFEKLFHLLK